MVKKPNHVEGLLLGLPQTLSKVGRTPPPAVFSMEGDVRKCARCCSKNVRMTRPTSPRLSCAAPTPNAPRC